MPRSEFDREMERPAPAAVHVDGVELRRGSRVRLRPRARGDVLDLALAGRIAVIEGIDQDQDDRLHLAVTVEDDPGRDLGEARHPGHRFFFAADEVEPLAPEITRPPRVLIAGIGNVFLGDDGFGVEVARRLHGRPRPAGVEVVDFGIRGVDLAYALGEDWDVAILVDAARRGDPPGTLYVIEAQAATGADVVPDGHGLDPVSVLRLARRLGACPPRVLVVACEPGAVPEGGPGDDVVVGLSLPVQRAVAGAVGLVESLVAGLVADGR